MTAHLPWNAHPGNKDRLFDGLMAAGITHVTVTFDGAGASGQIESIGAWSGETAVDFPATEIEYAALTWDDPEVEMRSLSLEDVVEQLAYDFLSDTHGGWENNDGAYGEFCFDARARCIHLEFNERFTSSELATHDFLGGATDMTDPAYLHLGLPATASPFTILRAAVRALHPNTRAVRGFRAARKRFYRQMLCAHAARQAAGDLPSG